MPVESRVTHYCPRTEWGGINLSTFERFVPSIQDVYASYSEANKHDLLIVTPWQMLPTHTVIQLPPILSRFADGGVAGWKERREIAISLNGYRGDATRLSSKGYELAMVFKDAEGKTHLAIPNTDPNFPGRLKALVVLNAIDEIAKAHATRQIPGELASVPA